MAKGGRSDIELMMRRSWGKLALGYFLDQKMDVEYWKALKAMPSENPPILQSLCLTSKEPLYVGIKNIDNEALKTVILANSNTLQHFALSNVGSMQNGATIKLMMGCPPYSNVN